MRIVILGSGGRLGAALTPEYQEKYDVAGLITVSLIWLVWMMCAEDSEQ